MAMTADQQNKHVDLGTKGGALEAAILEYNAAETALTPAQTRMTAALTDLRAKKQAFDASDEAFTSSFPIPASFTP